jgi:hypothetical protein
MDATGGYHVKWRIPGSEKENHMILSYVEDKSKDKHIHKNKHDHIQTQM